MIHHVYGGTIPEGEPLAGAWTTILVTPHDPHGKLEIQTQLSGLPFLTSFDHEPTDEEMEALQDTHEGVIFTDSASGFLTTLRQEKRDE